MVKSERSISNVVVSYFKEYKKTYGKMKSLRLINVLYIFVYVNYNNKYKQVFKEYSKIKNVDNKKIEMLIRYYYRIFGQTAAQRLTTKIFNIAYSD